jgi:hypothetical protein
MSEEEIRKIAEFVMAAVESELKAQVKKMGDRIVEKIDRISSDLKSLKSPASYLHQPSPVHLDPPVVKFYVPQSHHRANNDREFWEQLTGSTTGFRFNE